jgi:hypothetical protein
MGFSPPNYRWGNGRNTVNLGEALEDGNESRQMGGMIPDEAAIPGRFI